MIKHKPIKALLIEDNLGDVRLIQEMLKNVAGSSFKLEYADRLLTGLGRFAAGNFNIVLLDLSLPDSRGFETFIKARDRMLKVPIIVFTSFDDEELAIKAVRAGAQDYLIKGHVDSKLLVRSIHYAIARKRVEESLQYRIKIEKCVAAISTKFNSLSSDEVDSGINWALQAIGQFSDIDRGYVFLLSNKTGNISKVYEWCDEKIESQIEKLKGRQLAEFPLLLENLSKLKNIHIRNVAELPAQAKAEKEMLHSQNIKSIVFVPMVYSGVLVGALRFDWIWNETAWLEEDITLLKMVGETIVNALERSRTEEALRESEERFRTVFETAEDSIFIKDRKLRYTQVNPAMEKLLEIPTLKLVGRTDNDIYGAETAEHIREMDLRVLKGEVVDEERSKSSNGMITTIHIIKVPMRNRAGEIIGLCGIARDISERKWAEDSLRKLSKKLVERVKELNFLNSIANLEEKANSSLDEMLQTTVEMIPNSWQYPEITCARIVVENQIFKTDNFKKTIWAQVSDIFVYGKKVGSVEVYYLQKKEESDEGPFTNEERSLLDAIGERLGEIIVHKKAADALRESEKRMRLVVQNLPMMVKALDKNNNIIMWNAECKRVTGYSAKDVINNSKAFELLYPNKVYRDMMWSMFVETKEDFRDLEMRMTCKDGAEKVIAWSNVSKHEPIPGWALWAVGVEITERKKVEEAMTIRLRYEEALAACSQTLLADTEKTITETLNYLQQASGVSRVYIFENFEHQSDGLCMRLIHELNIQDAGPKINNHRLLQSPYKHGFSRWQKELSKGNPIVGLVEYFPKAERDIFQPQNILSMLVLPIWVAGEWYGFIGFDDTINKRNWDIQDIRLLQTAAEMIGAYTERKSAQEALQKSEQKWRLLYENLPGGSFVVNNRYIIEDVNDVLCAVTGYKKEELIGRSCEILCQKEQHKCPIFKLGKELIDNDETMLKTKAGQLIPIIKSARRIPLADKELVVENFQDNTGYKQVQEKLRQKRDRSSNIVDRVHELAENEAEKKDITESEPNSEKNISKSVTKLPAVQDNITTAEGEILDCEGSNHNNKTYVHKILVAEDEEIVRAEIKTILEHKYQLSFAKNGREAVDKYFSENPDIVLMDIMMPEMNGYDAYDEIIEKSEPGDILIIAVTARTTKGEKQAIIEYGFDDCISKPVDDQLLHEMLEKYLKEE